MPRSCRIRLSTCTACASEHTNSDVSAMITVMLGVHQMAHKLPASRFSGKRYFSHLEFRRANGYVRPVTVGEITCGSAIAVFTRLLEGSKISCLRRQPPGSSPPVHS